MSSISTEKVVETILEHHGVQGMKWGHRSNTVIGADRHERRAIKKAAKQDKQFIKRSASLKGRIELNNKAADHFNARIDAINNKPEYVKARDKGQLANLDHPMSKKYHKEVSGLFLESAQKAADTMVSASGNKKLSIAPIPGHLFEYNVVVKDIKHADDSFRVIFEHDEDGIITGFHFDMMEQSGILIDDILEHHGIQGMKWGHRKETAAFVKANPTGRSRADAIRRARTKTQHQRELFKTERDPVKREQLKNAYLRNPDRATAARFTRGEKVTIGLLAGASVRLGVPAFAVGLGLGTILTVAVRRHIEKQQARK